MLYLKQSTASQSVLIGPFVDATDGNTAETGLTIDAADIRLSKNGANIVGKNSGGGTHDELGYYSITLDATDTDTVGRLQLMVHESGALPVYHEFFVLEEAVYDALFAASALGYVANAPVNVAQFGGANLTAASGIPEVKVASLANNAITAASINADAITAAKVASDVTTEIQLGLATAADLATVDTVVDAIKAKTDSLTFTKAGEVDANVQSINGTTLTGDGSGTPWGPA
jgi:hypothetical protein